MNRRDSEFEELLVSRITDHIEKGIAEQESKKFRNLYIIVGFVSFLGFGVISQLIDFYASRAIESKIEDTRQELDSAKMYVQLFSLATKIDMSDSFTRIDRDTVLALLEDARDDKKLRSEPAFISLLEVIIDSFWESDNPIQIERIVSMYKNECIQNSGIALTLLQHYGRQYLAEVDVDSKVASDTFSNLHLYIGALSGGETMGFAEGFRVLAEFKKNKLTKTESIDRLLSSFQAFNNDERIKFKAVVDSVTDLEALSDNASPQVLRASAVGKAFMTAYESELNSLTINDVDKLF